MSLPLVIFFILYNYFKFNIFIFFNFDNHKLIHLLIYSMIFQ